MSIADIFSPTILTYATWPRSFSANRHFDQSTRVLGAAKDTVQMDSCPWAVHNQADLTRHSQS